MTDQENRYIPAHAEPFPHPLVHFAKRLNQKEAAVKIVALGSSSTAGEGGIIPYTYRLEEALRRIYPTRMIDVLNRGIGGEEAVQELARMQNDVIDERPSLVVWQVGTNAVWQRGHDMKSVAAAIAGGLERLGAEGIDVVLMDLQYVPALLTDDKIDGTMWMQSTIAQLAGARSVNVFGRFDLMRKYFEVERVSFDRMIDPNDPNRLHHSDWSARRVGEELSETIAAAVRGSA